MTAGKSLRVGFISSFCEWVYAGLQAVGKDRYCEGNASPPSLDRQHPLRTSVSLHFENVDEINLVQGKVWEHMAGAGGTLATWT